uniref:Uncharacterized protein n=1 Tax=Arundo donax TaxID=35708 RepID=A0A0A9H383_ARUDO
MMYFNYIKCSTLLSSMLVFWCEFSGWLTFRVPCKLIVLQTDNNMSEDSDKSFMSSYYSITLGNMLMHTTGICLTLMKDVTLGCRVVTGTMTINLMKTTIFISLNS